MNTVRSPLARLGRAGATLLGASLLALPLFALQKGPPGGSSSDSPNRGDEDIGTLPATFDWPERPGLWLVGSPRALEGAVLHVAGTGEVVQRPLDGTGLVRLGFLGELDVVLDAGALAEDRVTGWFVSGLEFAGGVAASYAKGAWSEPHALQPDTMRELPLAALGALEEHGSLVAVSPSHARYTLTLQGGGGAVLIEQGARP